MNISFKSIIVALVVTLLSTWSCQREILQVQLRASCPITNQRFQPDLVPTLRLPSLTTGRPVIADSDLAAPAEMLTYRNTRTRPEDAAGGLYVARFGNQSTLSMGGLTRGRVG